MQATLGAVYEPTGFDRRFPDYMGIIECCPSAAEGIVSRIDENGIFTELTSQTTFGDGVTPLSDLTMAIRPTVTGEYHVWIDGTKHIKTSIETVSLQTPTAGVIAYYFNHEGVLSWGSTPIEGLFEEYAVVSVVTYNTIESKKILFRDERHGCNMDGTTHKYLHNSIGTGYVSGATIYGLVDNATDLTTIDGGVFYDEDLPDTTPSQTTLPFWFREGIGGQWNSSTLVNTKLGYSPAGAVQYNLNTGGVWSLEDIGNSYIIMHIIYSGDVKYPYVKIIGQNLYGDRTTARERLDSEVSLLQLDGLPSPEFKFLYSMIIHNESTGQIETGLDGEIYIDHRTGHPAARFV
jgi:hypothetical protein